MITIGFVTPIKAEDAITEAIHEGITKGKGGYKPGNLSHCAVPIVNKCTQFFVKIIALCYRSI